MKKNWLLLSISFLLGANYSLADSLQQVEMADQFRADGKIYVVVLVILIIVIGLGFYTFRLDQKITNLEKRNDKKHD